MQCTTGTELLIITYNLFIADDSPTVNNGSDDTDGLNNPIQRNNEESSGMYKIK
jgi:hypothetical protein